MASVKTNKTLNRTPFLKTDFSWLETLSWAWKDSFTLKVLKMQFVFSWDWKCQTMQIRHCSIFFSFGQRLIIFLGPLEWRNLFRPKEKVSSHEKLVFGSGVRFLFLFVLMDAILLKLDLQKRTAVLDNHPNGKFFVYQKCILYPKLWHFLQ